MKKKLQLKVNFTKFTLLLLLLTLSTQVKANELLVSGSALIAQIKENKVTIKMQNASLKAILFEINKQTKINFVYDETELKSFPVKSVDVTNVTVEKILTDIFMGTNYTYKVTGNSVSIIKRVPQTESASTVKRVLRFTGKSLMRIKSHLSEHIFQLLEQLMVLLPMRMVNLIFLQIRMINLRLAILGKRIFFIENHLTQPK